MLHIPSQQYLDMSQPSIPKGTRDFSPEVMVKRNYIFNTIRGVFQRYGYMPLETPSMENVETLTGKYGDEGDKLIFRILDSGDYLKDIPNETLQERKLNVITKGIAEKALRYDLTVPFARFVVMNQHSIAFPFKRYQIQPVWRADRPQKGRYREFYQCDADVVGSDSLLNEVELVQIFDDALTILQVPSIIKINNRKILQGVAELAGVPDRMMEMTNAIDKLDKVGEDGVVKELGERGFSEASIATIRGLFALSGSNEERLNVLSERLAQSPAGVKGIEELRYVMQCVSDIGLKTATIELDLTLARGLNYYTGAIFEVKAEGVQMGSICGGGRYDDLTGIFGLKGVSGVGISFGADRIFDVMTELNVFPADAMQSTKVLFTNFGEKEEQYCVRLLRRLRDAGINAEIYPENAKMKKQFKYADDKRIPFVAIVGEEEMKNNIVALKDMQSGEQTTLTADDLIARLLS
jgi:histidyl-tRNA synthetase